MRSLKNSAFLILFYAIVGCVTSQHSPNSKKYEILQSNELLKEWEGPYQGVPAFDKIKLSQLEEAYIFALEQKNLEIEAIANNSAQPTFANTIEAYEKAGKLLDRVSVYADIWSSNISTPQSREILSKLAPIASMYSSKIIQNEKLFQRIKSVYNSKEYKRLSKTSQRLVSLTYNQFFRNGANLDSKAKKKYASINKKLAELYTKFSNNVLADEEKYVIFLSENQLSGLPESFKNAAALSAKNLGKEGYYAITNTRSSMDPFLTFSDDRTLRKKVWENYYNRGDNNDDNDNNRIISEILNLRQERVRLLGYSNYASWRLEDRMAKNPKNAISLMTKVWPAALARVKEEVADMQNAVSKEGSGFALAGWDYRYYAEKVRELKYAFDSNEVKQYLVLENLQKAMFYVAERLFNYEIKPVAKGSVPVFHSDVTVWEVNDKTTGTFVGLWYLDPYARKGKRSGAWASSYRSHSTFDGKQTVLASNNSNFIKGKEGQPVLVSWEDAETFFHEFGHALHSLSSNVAYPTLNWGVRDYTEFQSQLLERWLLTDEVINKFLVHNKTGKPMPKALVQKLRKAATFNEGFKTTEYLASAILDMKLHTSTKQNIDPAKFEKDTLVQLAMPKEIVMRHRLPHFSHIFSGEGYAAGYYGYLWAEVLTSDAAEAFINSPGGFYDKNMATKLVKYLFSPRNALDPAEAFRSFRSRDASVEALMRDRGFPLSN